MRVGTAGLEQRHDAVHAHHGWTRSKHVRKICLYVCSSVCFRQVVGKEIVESAGGQLKLLRLVDGRSTSEIVERIRGSSPPRVLDGRP